MREQQPEHHTRALEHVGQAHVHPLDDLLPQYRIDAQHAHRAGEERDVPRREELPLRRKLRKHPRGGVNEERANQGDVFKDGEHLVGNIEFAQKKIPKIFMKRLDRAVKAFAEGEYDKLTEAMAEYKA